MFKSSKLSLSAVCSLALGIIFSSVSSPGAQSFNAVLKAIDNLETKLTAMVQTESGQRKEADKALSAKLDKKSFTAKSEPAVVDNGLRSTVDSLAAAVAGLKGAEETIARQMAVISKKIGEISSKNEDAEVHALAGDLKNLVTELKTAIRHKEEVSQEAPEAMEIGGVVTVDYGGDPQALDEATLEMGTVELGANVNVSDRITASLTLLAEGDMAAIAIDQAMASYESDDIPYSIYFGLHAFNHGLMNTHLISDPLLLDAVEMVHPGLTAVYTKGASSFGAAFTIIAKDYGDSTAAHIGILNYDHNFGEESMARLSLNVSEEMAGAGAAAALALSALSIDAEAYTQIMVPDTHTKASGYLLGIAYGLKDNVEIALRHDGFSEDSFKDMTLRFGAGLTYNITEEIFAAVEYGFLGPSQGKGTHEVALQVGIESNIKLPGFQRKTLTRN